MQFIKVHHNGEDYKAPAHPALGVGARTATTLALSMLAFNVAAFVPAGAAPAAKPPVKTAAAKPAVVKKAPAKMAASAPYMPKHRSIWAIRWAAAHPAQEAIFQAQLERRWRARHHLPMVGVAKAMPARPAPAKAAAKHVAAKAPAHAPIKMAAIAHAAAKHIAPRHIAARADAVKHAPAKVALAAHAVRRPAYKKPASKVAKAAPAMHKPLAHMAQAKHPAHARIVQSVAKHPFIAGIAATAALAGAHEATRPASKASTGKVRLAQRGANEHRRVAQRPSHGRPGLAKAHTTDVAALPVPIQMRQSAIKQAVAASRPAVQATPAAATASPASVKLASADTSRPASATAQQSQAAATSLQGSDTVTLDFVAADINDVLKALAVQTGANIVSSADVKGTVTVSLSNVTLDQALDMVARLSGYEYAKVGNTYVVGTSSGIQALTGAAGGTQQESTEVVTFNYANPNDVVSALKQRFPDMQVSMGTSISGIKAGAGAKAMILTGDPALLVQAKTLIGQIDQSMGANVVNESTVAYTVKYASLPDLITILGNLVPNLVVTPGPSQGFTAKAPSAAASAASSSGSAASSPSSSSGSSTGSSSGSSQAAAIGPTMLLLTGTDADIARAQQILGQVDVQPKQILFETKVVEMSDDAERQLGLTYDFSGASTTIGEDLPPGVTPDSGTPEPDPYPGNILKGRTFGRTYINDFVTVQLHALETDGKAKLLADPDISAIDGQPAQVFIGDEINYVSSITTSTTGENVTTSSVQVGVTLRVTGKVDDDGYITLNIHPEVSTINQWVQVTGGGELPDVSTRYADTTIRVKDGDTIALGGLIQQNDVESIQKVPILGDLPFFGQLFRYNDHQVDRDDVVFFLKTSIMRQG